MIEDHPTVIPTLITVPCRCNRLTAPTSRLLNSFMTAIEVCAG
jgi:hypothetical protein